jgi:hypothetical protein
MAESRPAKSSGGFGMRALSGSTLASITLYAIVYLLLPLSLPTAAARKQLHCHCPMCNTDSGGTHQCCHNREGICTCDMSEPDEDSDLVIIRDIASSPLSYPWNILFDSDRLWLTNPVSVVEPEIPVITPPPKI